MKDLTLLPTIGSVILVVIAMIAAVSLPKTVAVHWNLAGEPDNFASKWVVVAVALLPIVLWLGLELLLRNTAGASTAQAVTGLRMAFPLLMAIFIIAAGYMILANHGVQVAVWILITMIVALALGFVALIVRSVM